MLQALGETLGIVAHACKKAGIERCTHYKWMREDEEYRNKVEEISDMAIDHVESALMQKIIQEKDTTAIIFYLKTKGKKRGYVERQEFEHSGEKIVIDFRKDG